MRIKLFQASNMAEAMRQVRAELGEDALILGNRRVADGVEITAALEPLAEEREMTEAIIASPRRAARPDAELRRKSNLSLRANALNYGALDWTRPIMLVGTPGAGKTLTAAKLATRLVQTGERPMIITTDGERAGATEQLAAFTRILNLELTIAENPLMIARALAGRQAGVKAIIDMAGFSPLEGDQHAAQREALITYAVTADANLVWVMPAGLDAEDAAEMAGVFMGLGARHMIVTRLDMTRRFESVLRPAEAGAFILTDGGIGPGIADGLIPLEPQYLVSRIDHEAANSARRQRA